MKKKENNSGNKDNTTHRRKKRTVKAGRMRIKREREIVDKKSVEK